MSALGGISSGFSRAVTAVEVDVEGWIVWRLTCGHVSNTFHRDAEASPAVKRELKQKTRRQCGQCETDMVLSELHSPS